MTRARLQKALSLAALVAMAACAAPQKEIALNLKFEGGSFGRIVFRQHIQS